MTWDLDTDGMADHEREAAEAYARMAGLDRPREELLAELRQHAKGAPVRHRPSP